MRTKIKALLCLVLCLALIAGSTVSAQAAKTPLVLAHRGYCKKQIENTSQAMLSAYNHKFDGVEMDVWEGKNGTLWIFHDPTLDHMTGKSGRTVDLTLQNYKFYPYKNGQQIQYLGDMLKQLQGKQNIYLHLKGNGTSRFMTKSGQDKLVRIIKRNHLENEVVVFASENKMQKLNLPGIKKGWTTTLSEKYAQRAFIKRARKAGVGHVILISMSQFDKPENRKRMSIYCHNRKIKLGIYSCKNREQYKKLRKYEVDFVMSDVKLKKKQM